MTITKEVLEKSYNKIKMFNEIAGNFEGDMEELVDNQLGYVFEELCETITALENKDAVGLLDGAVDGWVTLVGLLQKLEAAGFNVAEAIRRVDENNLSKCPPHSASGGKVVYDTLTKNQTWSVTLNDKYQKYVIKDTEGKVRKPISFEPVNLSDCVPKDFFKE